MDLASFVSGLIAGAGGHPTVPAPNSSPPLTITTTRAAMHLLNTTPDPITVTISDENSMSTSFPNATIQGRSHQTSEIVAAADPFQSSFVININRSPTAKVEIGSGTYRTAVTYLTNDSGPGRLGAIAAPMKPFGDGQIDYDIFLIFGTPTVARYINSFLDANVPSLQSALSSLKPSFDVSGYKIHVLGFRGNPSCRYASVEAVDQIGSNFILNTIFELPDGGVNGTASIGTSDPSFGVTVKDLVLRLRVKIDLRTTMSIEVEELRVSLRQHEYTGAAGAILTTWGLNAPMAQIFSSYNIAGFINRRFQSKILNKINSFIKDKLQDAGSGNTQEMFTKHGGLPGEEVDTLKSLKTDNQRKQPQYWMGDPKVRIRTLEQLRIVGTHDSATARFDDKLSEVKYDDISILWKMVADKAPVDGRLNFPLGQASFDSSVIHLGQAMYDFVFGTMVKNFAHCQDLSILKQLQYGVRHLDLRVYYDSREKDFYLQHALRGIKFSEVLTDIHSFITGNPGAEEIVFANISHTYLDGKKDLQNELTELIRYYIPADRIVRGVPSTTESDPFQALASTKIRDLTRGVSVVMFLNGDAPNIQYEQTITNSCGFAARPFTGKVPPLTKKGNAKQVDKSVIKDMVASTLLNLSGQPNSILADFALKNNTALRQELSKKEDWNLVEIDWCHLANGWDPVAEVIKWNKNESDILRGTSLTESRELTQEQDKGKAARDEAERNRIEAATDASTKPPDKGEKAGKD